MQQNNDTIQQPSLPPLLRQCDVCEGSCVTLSDEWREWNARWDAAYRAECRKRHGSYEEANCKPVDAANAAAGPMPGCPEQVVCDACHGRGVVLTDAGRQIIDLLYRLGFRASS